MLHHSQGDSMAVAAVSGKGDAIVADGQDNRFVHCRQMDLNLASLTVMDRFANGILGDAI